MAIATATLANKRVTYARVSIPAWGAWYADVACDGEFSLTGAATLTIADASFQGTILSGGAAKGRSFFRMVAGAGGWGQTLKKRAYNDDAGVKLITVLSDAAAEVGETLDTTTVDSTIRLGSYWARPPSNGDSRGIAANVLQLVAPNGWYVDVDGQTRLGSRASATLSLTVPRTSQIDLARGTLTLAPESIASILPGIAVDSLTAVDVEHEISTKEGLRTTIWGKSFSQTSRRLSALRAIYDQLDPGRAYRGVTEYRVVTLSGQRVNLQAIRVSTGMPDLQRVQMRPGVAGCYATLALGARVLVGFIDSNPAYPYVAAFEDVEGGGYLPTALALAGGGAAVARSGDTIQITPAQWAAATPIDPQGGSITLTNTLHGTISSGSSKVTCG